MSVQGMQSRGTSQAWRVPVPHQTPQETRVSQDCPRPLLGRVPSAGLESMNRLRMAPSALSGLAATGG